MEQQIKISVKFGEGEVVHAPDSPLAHPMKIPADEPCWSTYFKYDRWLHLQIREGNPVVIAELDRLATKAMSNEGLVLRACDKCTKYLCYAHTVEELIRKALKGELG